MSFKNHVGKHGKTLNRELKSMFGDLLGKMEQALDTSNPEEQQRICQELGEMNLESQLYKDLSPQIKQAVINQIQATTQYNIDQSEILKEAGKGALSIKKAAAQTSLANKELFNKSKENSVDYYLASKQEKQRHELEMNYLRLNGMIRQAMGLIEGKSRLITASVQPELRQIQETRRHQNTVVKHLLSNGDESRVDLIHEKDYKSLKTPITGFLSKVSEKLGLYL